MSWRCLETSRTLSFCHVAAHCLVYIMAHRPLSQRINANYFLYTNSNEIILIGAVSRPSLYRDLRVQFPIASFIWVQDFEKRKHRAISVNNNPVARGRYYLPGTVEPRIWRWIFFHLFFHINLDGVEPLHELLQDDLSTGRLADGICMVIELLHDLSTGHRTEEHRDDVCASV